MAGKDKLATTALDNYGKAAGQQDQVKKKKSNVSPKSIANLHAPTKSEVEVKRATKYMTLDIIEFEDYLNRMSKYKGMTRTKYIQSLIRADMELHEREYGALRNLSDFDTKPRSRKPKSEKSKVEDKA